MRDGGAREKCFTDSSSLAPANRAIDVDQGVPQNVIAWKIALVFLFTKFPLVCRFVARDAVSF